MRKHGTIIFKVLVASLIGVIVLLAGTECYGSAGCEAGQECYGSAGCEAGQEFHGAADQESHGAAGEKCFGAAGKDAPGTPESDSLAFFSADWNWQDLGKGAQAGYAQLELFGSTQSIAVVRYPGRKYRTGFVSATGEDAGPTDTLAIRAGARFALNGSYFNMKTLEPATFFAINRKQLGSTCENELFRTNGLLAVRRKNGRKLFILPYEPTQESAYSKKYYASLASGPVLIIDGKTETFDLNDRFVTDRHPRSFVGITSEGTVYLVVVDGRFRGEAAGASIPELARIAGWLGLCDAINFDGGGSSAVWTDETGIINHPCDNRKFDHRGARRVPDIISVTDRRQSPR